MGVWSNLEDPGEKSVGVLKISREVEDLFEGVPAERLHDRGIAGDLGLEIALVEERVHGVALDDLVRVLPAHPAFLGELEQELAGEHETLARVEVPAHA